MMVVCLIHPKNSFPIAAIDIVLGIVALAIPFLGSMGSCGPFVDAICDMRCSDNQCSDLDKQAPCLARPEI